VLGDTTAEKDETFAVALGKPVGNATLPARFYGIGTIVNDDGAVATKAKAASFTAKVRPAADHTSPFSYRVSGVLGLPSGVSASKACTGKVRVRVLSGSKTLVTKTARLNKTCGYAASVSFTKAPSKKRITFTVQFLGNSVLSKTGTKTLHGSAG
jgi:hypothetical protein